MLGLSGFLLNHQLPNMRLFIAKISFKQSLRVAFVKLFFQILRLPIAAQP